MLPDVTHRAEDLDWMAAAGEGTEGAAKRLGVSPDSLERWCQRNGHADIWRRLVCNGPRDWNTSSNKDWSAA